MTARQPCVFPNPVGMPRSFSMKGRPVLERWNRWTRNHPRWSGGLLFLTTYVVFCGTLSNLLVHDDIPQVLENPFLRNHGSGRASSPGRYGRFAVRRSATTCIGRSSSLSYWLLYRVNGPESGGVPSVPSAVLCGLRLAGFPFWLRFVARIRRGICGRLALGPAPPARGNGRVGFRPPGPWRGLLLFAGVSALRPRQKRFGRSAGPTPASACRRLPIFPHCSSKKWRSRFRC